MAQEETWVATGMLRKNSLLRLKAVVKRRSNNSEAAADATDFYTFPCSAKGFFSLKDAPTWSVVTDDPAQLTGKTYVGKTEGAEPIEVSTETVFDMNHEFAKHQVAGDIFTLIFTYDDPLETKIYTITIDDCQVLGVSTETSDINGGSTTTFKFQPVAYSMVVNSGTRT